MIKFGETRNLEDKLKLKSIFEELKDKYKEVIDFYNKFVFFINKFKRGIYYFLKSQNTNIRKC